MRAPEQALTLSAAEIAAEHARALEYLGLENGAELSWQFIRTLMASVAGRVVFPAQDLLGLGTEARMNRPRAAAQLAMAALAGGSDALHRGAAAAAGVALRALRRRFAAFRRICQTRVSMHLPNAPLAAVFVLMAGSAAAFAQPAQSASESFYFGAEWRFVRAGARAVELGARGRGRWT